MMANNIYATGSPMKKLLLIVLCLSGAAAAEDWPKLVDLDGGAVLHGKPGSASLGRDEHNRLIVTADTRFTAADGKSVSLYEMSIGISDCIKEKGKLTMTSPDGKHNGDAPFMFGSGTGFSVVAEILCSIALEQLRESGEPSAVSAP
jgi:hypothetical protein